MLEHWIWLATRQGLNKRKLYECLQQYGDPERIYESRDEQLPACLKDRSITEAERILALCRKQDIRLLPITDEHYPGRLQGIYDPPVLLYYRGELPDWEAKPIIGAVGTRHCSSYGARSARLLGSQLIRCGGCVTSGMAEGIDAAVLRGVLEAEGAPVVFLAGGVDVIYPAENRSLYHEILAGGGCILSEQPPGSKPSKWLFPARNRLISGVSNGVLVVEAPAKSGALITARHAMEQGREVYTVPGPIDEPACQGSNTLLKDGARFVQSGWDILESYQGRFEGLQDLTRIDSAVVKNPVELPLWSEKTAQSRAKDKKVIDNTGKQPYSDVDKKPPVLSGKEQAIIDQLLSGPKPTDAVLDGCGLPRGEALATITMLEISGTLRRLPGDLMALNEH